VIITRKVEYPYGLLEGSPIGAVANAYKTDRWTEILGETPLDNRVLVVYGEDRMLLLYRVEEPDPPKAQV